MTEHNKQPLIAIVGPTASGKSSCGVSLAQKIGGEIVSADSVQLYRGLDIGSEKITTDEMGGVPHHMISVLDPGEEYSVAQYKEDAQQVIADIHDRGAIPLLVGGTGYYIHAVIDDISLPNVPPNHALREELAQHTTDELAARLAGQDPQRYATIDRNNRTRLIRAIEIVAALGAVPQQEKSEPYRTLQIGLDVPPKQLRDRITQRLDESIARGLIDEVRTLRSQVSDAWLESIGLEYKYTLWYIRGEFQTRDEYQRTLEQKIWQYAKRQRTWFRRDARIEWFAPEDYEQIEKRGHQFLEE